MQVLPTHIGIIMDGNGRWATEQGKKRSEGHLEGLKVTKRIVKQAQVLGIKYLSLYVFSTENWKRTEDEVSYLMNLITLHLRREYEFYRENGIKVVHSGDLTLLPTAVQAEIKGVEEDTQQFNQLMVNLLINYGGQNEICRAVNNLIKQGLHEINKEDIESALDQPILPPIDLIIRTAGEQRLSNFMIWQSSYAEYFFCNKLWPSFTEEDFTMAIENYEKRQRRFGGL